MQKGFLRPLSSQDILFKVGKSTHMDFLLLFQTQSIFQNIQKRSGVFLSLDLWKAIKEAGKQGPLGAVVTGAAVMVECVCMCVSGREQEREREAHTPACCRQGQWGSAR